MRKLCQQKAVALVEGQAKPDHVHMFLRLSPKYSVAFTLRFFSRARARCGFIVSCWGSVECVLKGGRKVGRKNVSYVPVAARAATLARVALMAGSLSNAARSSPISVCV